MHNSWTTAIFKQCKKLSKKIQRQDILSQVPVHEMMLYVKTLTYFVNVIKMFFIENCEY